jgi:osmotically-inducible protein OsmY
MLRKTVGAWLGAAAIAVTTIACSQSDPGVTTAVKSKLAADDVVKAYRIDVDTKDRVVTLSGAVDTAAARTRAVELARGTEGVREVVDQLTVAPGATPTTGMDDAISREAREATAEGKAAASRAGEKADAKTDEAQRKAGDAADKAGDAAGNAALTAAVKTKFLADTDVSGLRIDVDSNNGVVTLTGTVRTAAEKTKAIAIAKETDGVKSVIDRLKVGR